MTRRRRARAASRWPTRSTGREGALLRDAKRASPDCTTTSPRWYEIMNAARLGELRQRPRRRENVQVRAETSATRRTYHSDRFIFFGYMVHTLLHQAGGGHLHAKAVRGT